MNNKSMFFVVATILFTFSGFAQAAGAAKAPPAGPEGDAKAGKEQSAVCAGCHGTDGNSPAPSFPKIANLGEKYLFGQLKHIRDGSRSVVEMTGMLDGKSDQDLLDLAAYFNEQTMQLSGAKEATVKVNAGIEVDALALGERVFRSGNLETGVPACTGCHSPRALGNDPAGFPRLSGQYAEYIAKQLRAYRGGERTTDGDAKTMRSVAKHMSDAEIDAVANFISGLH